MKIVLLFAIIIITLNLLHVNVAQKSATNKNKQNDNKETKPQNDNKETKPVAVAGVSKQKSGEHRIHDRNSPKVFDPNHKNQPKPANNKGTGTNNNAGAGAGTAPGHNKNPGSNNSNKNKYKVKKTHNKQKPPAKPKQNKKWKPKPNKSHPKPGKKYSGWKPVEWGNTTNIIDEDGSVLNRTSQTKFEEYMEEIFGAESRLDTALLTPEELNGRELADPGEYPHMAAIGVIRDFEDIIDWKCGGSLISRQYVLTAAHCCDFGGEHPTHVELGAIDLRKQSSDFEDGSVTKQIEEVIIHPYYDDDSYYYDIGLLKLTENVIFSSKIRPVQLWPLEYIPYEFGFACGFGATAFGHVQTNVLTEMNLDLIGNEECNKALPVLDETPFGILDNQLCARDLDGIVDTCQGDSGGPLQLNLPSRRRPLHSLIGIVSYGVFCGSSYPGVYTRVYSYLPWIESIVWPRTFKVYNPNFVFPNN